MTDTVVTAARVSGESPLQLERHNVLDIDCIGDFSYWRGVSSVWQQGITVVNIEHDMEHSDGLVDGLLECDRPACAYAYTVYPTALGHYIYCATTNRVTDEEFDNGVKVRWLEKGETEALWSSIGFCKLAPEAQVIPLDRIFWPWFEHTINRSVSRAECGWHIHWPEVQHFHDYERVPDHLW